MFVKTIVVFCAVAAGASGLLAPTYYGSPYSSYPAQPAIATQHQNILRSPYNLGQISSFSKTVNTPYSSVSKSDVRVSNPGLAVAPAYHGLASAYSGLAPAYQGLAPAYHGLAPAYHGLAPAYQGYASPVVSHVGVAPVAKVATAGGLLGVAYSAAPAVSHMTYSNGLGLSYAW